MTRLLLLSLCLVLWCHPAMGQITITEQDLRDRLDEGHFAFQMFFSGLDDDATEQERQAFLQQAQTILEQVESGNTYDFRNFDFSLSLFAFNEVRPAPFDPDLPGADTFNDTEAEYVTINTGGFVNAYDYIGFRDDGQYEYGSVLEGEEPEVNDPPVLELPLPVEMGSEWSSIWEYAGFRDSTHHEVIGYGQLRTPGGSAPTLVIRAREYDVFDDDIDFVSETHNFYTKDFRLAGFIATDDEEEIEVAGYWVESDESASQDVASGATGTIIDQMGVQVELTQGSTTDGTLRAYRVNFPPSHAVFTGSATSGDGTSITPNVVSQDEHFFIHATGLSGHEYRICLDYGNLSGVNDPGKLVILHRVNAGEAWTPLDTEQDADSQQVCASGLSASQFAVGSDEAYNALPVELASFEATRHGENTHLTWSTSSELNNAGFAVERQVNEMAFEEIGFISGQGTTTHAHTYSFTDDDVPFTALSVTYRLKQTDFDGSSQYSPEVQVEMALPQQLTVEAPFPNPAQGATTLRYSLPHDGRVTVTVYDLLGREVATPVNGTQEAGPKEVHLNVSGFAPGAYFYQVRLEGSTQTKRFVVIR